MDQSEPTGDPGTPAPPPTTPTAGWAAPPPPPVQAGPAGFVYADVPNRAIALIIDWIALIVISIIVGIVLVAIGLADAAFGATDFGIGRIIVTVIGLAVSAGYFIYTWTTMRGTVGMKVLGMQVGNAGDGKTLTTEQAFRRWIALGAPFSIGQLFGPLSGIGALIALLSIGWFIYLLWTTYSSPTKQGFHDKFANTMVVKAARSAG